MTEDQRNFKFGTPPTTVYDSLKNFISNASVSEILCAGDVFSDKLLRSYSCAMLDMWQMELVERIIPSNISVIRNYTKLHDIDNSYDSSLWQEIQRIKIALAKNTDENYSVFGSIKSAIENKNLNEISKLQIRMNLLMNELASLYKEYSDNQI